MAQSWNYIAKIVSLGDSACGKSSVITTIFLIPPSVSLTDPVDHPAMRRPLFTPSRRYNRRRIREPNSTSRAASLTIIRHQQPKRIRQRQHHHPPCTRDFQRRTETHEALVMGHGRPRNLQINNAVLLPRRKRRPAGLRHHAPSDLQPRDRLAERPTADRGRRHHHRTRRQQERSCAGVDGEQRGRRGRE